LAIVGNRGLRHVFGWVLFVRYRFVGRFVQQQKGLITRLRAAGVDTWDAQKILSLLESNLRRFEEHRDRLRASVRR
jgi:hypothetical protein